MDARRIVDGFRGLTVLVVGDAMLDRYLEGATRRLSPEAPVPVVVLARRHDAPGGAANTAVNVRALGARPVLLGVTGADEAGRALRRTLEARGVSTEHLLRSRRRSLLKQRVTASSQLLLRIDDGTTAPAAGRLEAALLERLEAAWPTCDAVLISDYGYGTVTSAVVDAVARLQAAAPRIVAVDSKDLGRYGAAAVTAVKPNFGQAMRLVDDLEEGARPRVEQVAAYQDRLFAATGAQIVAVTLDAEGAVVLERGRDPYRTYAEPVPDVRAAGAGDTFLSAFALALAAGAATTTAAEVAAAAAGVVVRKEGTATCSAVELRRAFAPDGKHLETPADVAECLAVYQERGARVVFTNGCFDILHRGHVTYLSRAKVLGDVLIVGINADASVRRLKGEGRPINTLADRIDVLGALSCVDHTVAFDEDTPQRLLEIIRPDVYVKGGDYTRDMLPEAPVVEQFGGTVRILPYVEDRSTTGIIERIRQRERMNADAAVG